MKKKIITMIDMTDNWDLDGNCVIACGQSGGGGGGGGGGCKRGGVMVKKKKSD
jgi:hypothetical protein